MTFSSLKEYDYNRFELKLENPFGDPRCVTKSYLPRNKMEPQLPFLSFSQPRPDWFLVNPHVLDIAE